MESHSRRMQELPEILGRVCFDLEPWKRELSDRLHARDEEGKLSQSTFLQKCLSGHAVIQQRPHTGLTGDRS